MEAFIDFLEQRAGPALRAVSWYDGDDSGIWYVRDDLDADVVEARLTELTERIIAGRTAGSSTLDDLGPEQAMVQLRTKAVILRFPTGEAQGIVVSLDVDAARNLHSFVVECSERLAGEPVLGRSS